MSGKGSTPRPFSVDADTYAERYARTFSRSIDDPSGYDPREKECPPLLLRPDGQPVTDADFPGADDAFRVTLDIRPTPKENVSE